MAGDRPAGPNRRLPVGQAREREVHRTLMLKYRGKQLIRAGFMGVVLAILIIGVGLAPERLMSWATAIRYQAQFVDAGGVVVGNDVVISGIKVGAVSDVALQGRNALVTFTIDGSVPLGS